VGQLEKEKEKLYKLLIKWGLSDDRVLRQSEKVDKLIIRHYEKKKARESA
jgi:DNA polymerase III delta prime subunit